MRKWKKTLIIIAAAFCLTGCGSSDSPAMNTVSIQKDGKIAHIIVEQFEKNYYNPEDLEPMAQEKIERYSNGEENIIFESAEASDGKVIVRMTYQSSADYMTYNNREMFIGTVGAAFEQGYSLKDIVGEDGNVISDEELSAIRENHVVIVQTKKGEELAVNVYDKILYTSENVALSGKKDAIIAAGEEDVISCIVFK